MNNLNQESALGRWIMAILAASLILAFARPSFSYLTHRDNVMALGLSADYGIPAVRWVKIRVPESELPPGSPPQILKFPSIGLDFNCVDTYLRCAGPGVQIYKKDCPGDLFGRFFMYPPLMSYLFAWIPLVSKETAMGIWTMFVLIGVFASVWVVAAVIRKLTLSTVVVRPILLAVAVTLSYPTMMAYERGNNDVWVLLIYAAATVALVFGKSFWTAFFVSVAVMLKLYPAPLLLTCGIIGLLHFRHDRRQTLMWLAGAAAGIAVIAIPLFSDYRYYLFEHYLARTSYSIAPGSFMDHSLIISYGITGAVIGGLLWILAMLSWCRSALELDEASDRKQRTLLAFTFLAALCTYLHPRTESFDYNLITAFPLLVCLVYAEPRSGALLLKVGAVLWTAGIALPRWINLIVFNLPERTFSAFLILQTIGLICIAAHLGWASFRQKARASL
jgi:hypothetical protein